MADLLLTCEKCGRVLNVSEYVETERVPCPECGAPIAVTRSSPAKANNGGRESPRIALRRPDSKTFLGGNRRPPTVHPETGEEMVDARVRSKSIRLKGPAIWMGWLAFVLCGGLLVGMLHVSGTSENLIVHYRRAQAAGWAVAWLFTVWMTWKDSSLQGIACLLFPPYALYALFTRADSLLLRGVAGGLILALAAELHYLGDRALGHGAQTWISNAIQSGESLLQRVSD